MREQRIPLTISPGVSPSTDDTALNSMQFIDMDKVRFYQGKMCKLGGWMRVAYSAFSPNTSITGCARSLFSFLFGNDKWILIGTHTNLYSFKQNVLTNITPVKTSTVAIADSLDTNYTTLGSNPITTVNGSTTVTIAHTAHKLAVNDSITIAGVPGDLNGIPVAQLNTTQTIRSIPTANTYTIIVTTMASSTGSGGGGSVIEKTPIITVNAAAHGLSNGDRVKIVAAATTGGIPDTEINAEHIIRNKAANTFDIVLTTKATSSVTGGGGASTTYQKPIDAGNCDFVLGYGYGMGLYGLGLYGVAKTAYNTSLTNPPRIWSMDRFGQNVVMTPGNQTNIYQWTVTTDTAPTPLTSGGAPTAVNYVFVTDNIVVALGPGGVENKLAWSDQGDTSQWTAAADNQAGSNTLRNAGRLVSHLSIRGTNLIFSKNKIYTMRYVAGSDYVFAIGSLFESDGIVAQNARVAHNGIGYWMGNNTFYRFNGSYVEEIANNTIKKYVFDRLTTNQQSKICAGVCREFNEIWWLYPSNTGANDNGYNENDSYVIYNIDLNAWYYGSIDRLAIEYPNKIDTYQYMINSDGVLFTHENGVNDDTSGMSWFADTNYGRSEAGTKNIEITGLMVDGIQTGSITITPYTRQDPRTATERNYGAKTVTPTTSKVNFRAYGNQRKYRFAGSDVDVDFQIGAITEFVKEGAYR